ncbi:MarR family winged helix-turn-helix transcriptional regulator [Geodermatophilus sp. SYSU D00691]
MTLDQIIRSSNDSMTEHTSDHPGVKRVLALLHETSEAMTRLAQRLAEESGTHPTDLTAVSVLARRADRPLTVSELSREMGLSRAATTSLVDRLEQAGHVQRVRSEGDRRQIHLQVTETAHTAADAVLGDFLARTRAALADYTDDELATAARLLADVTAALTPDGDADGPPPRT